MSKADFNEVEINFRTIGKGTDIIFIHGLAANQAFWHLNLLLPMARKYKVTLYDLRGHGYSSMPAKGYTLADMCMDLHNLINHLNIPAAHIIGHSFGGAVALLYAILYPQRVKSLTILDTRIRAIQKTNRISDWPNLKNAREKMENLGFLIPEDETEAGIRLLEQLAKIETRELRKTFECNPVLLPFNSWSGGKKSAQRWLNLLDSTTARRDLSVQDGLTLQALSTIQQPSLVISGGKSPTLRSGQELKRLLPDCTFAVVPEAGHFFPISHQEFLLNLLLSFLDKVEQEERRKFGRFDFELFADIRFNSGYLLNAKTLNIAREGVLLKSDTMPDIGSEIEFMPITEEEHYLATIKSHVVRTENMDEECQFSVVLESDEPDYRKWEAYFNNIRFCA